MKYTKEQRLDIGRRIYDGELTRYEAAEEYGISEQTARDSQRLSPPACPIQNSLTKQSEKTKTGIHTS